MERPCVFFFYFYSEMSCYFFLHKKTKSAPEKYHLKARRIAAIRFLNQWHISGNFRFHNNHLFRGFLLEPLFHAILGTDFAQRASGADRNGSATDFPPVVFQEVGQLLPLLFGKQLHKLLLYLFRVCLLRPSKPVGNPYYVGIYHNAFHLAERVLHYCIRRFPSHPRKFNKLLHGGGHLSVMLFDKDVACVYYVLRLGTGKCDGLYVV